MSVINQIKAEIERRKGICTAQIKANPGQTFPFVMEMTGYDKLLSFLDTLEEKSEIPTNLDSLLDDYFEKLVVPEHQIIFENTYRKIATDFYRMGQGASEKPNNHEGLDEAAEMYEEERISDYGYRGEWSGAFIAGAEWDRSQGETQDAEVGYWNQLGLSILLDKSLERLGFSDGDKVIVQIRKKN